MNFRKFDENGHVWNLATEEHDDTAFPDENPADDTLIDHMEVDGNHYTMYKNLFLNFVLGFMIPLYKTF